MQHPKFDIHATNDSPEFVTSACPPRIIWQSWAFSASLDPVQWVRTIGSGQFFSRFAVTLCVIASMCSVDISFAQTPIPYDGKPTIIGRWKLVTINGVKAEGREEEIGFEDERLHVREDCNSATYRYVVKDGKMIAKPDLITLVYCDDDRTRDEEIALHNQRAIISAIIHSKVLLNGDTLTLLPNSPGGEVVFHRLDWFEIGRRPGP